jgi:predicted heme/steroid binding protein
MRVQDLSGRNLDRILAEINYDINLLYVIPCIYTRNMILNHLRYRMSVLQYVTNAMNQTEPPKTQSMHLQTAIAPVGETPLQIQQLGQIEQKTFTLKELSKYDGKGGNPAYVAVNGIVYDVTNNAAWAAATHFGLPAGKDLTSEFASCHAAQPILSKLKVVGKLV